MTLKHRHILRCKGNFLETTQPHVIYTKLHACMRMTLLLQTSCMNIAHRVQEKSKPKFFGHIFYKTLPILIKVGTQCPEYICYKVLQTFFLPHLNSVSTPFVKLIVVLVKTHMSENHNHAPIKSKPGQLALITVKS